MWIVAAHPDDETIGATSLLLEHGISRILYVTDGAPARAYWTAPLLCSRRDYAELRRFELDQALRIAGFPGDACEALGFPDQEAHEHAFEIVTALVERVTRARPRAIVTHAYEGRHPDHDTVALCVQAAAAMIAAAQGDEVRVVEMRSELSRASLFRGGVEPERRALEWTRLLSLRERSAKRHMLSCFRTQQLEATLDDVLVERFRNAPAYDFSVPPHAATLEYARRGWTSWDRFASAATAALRRLGLDTRPLRRCAR